MSATTIVAHGGVLDDWLQRRRALGLDKRDEVWNGTHHVAPHAHASHGRLAARLVVVLDGPASAAGLVALTEFNLGVEDDFRVPDLGLVRQQDEADLGLYLPTAEVVVGIVSPDDASRAKIPSYLGRGVREVWLIDPAERVLTVHTSDARDAGPAGRPARSAVLGLDVEEVTRRLGW
ncbi:Uma2 family endonuclease [Kineococcus sp. SYSU DK004]|uniref:Uma2 family endonuclease n=1 Tax=Kineococcus sp. SYSU DK004 TaxID=3383125 RepID=UPI003D7E9E4D